MPAHLSGHPGPMTDALRPHGIEPRELSDDDLVREVTHLHETRHDAMRGASESAFEVHTSACWRWSASTSAASPRTPPRTRCAPAPAPARTPGQPVPGRDLGGAPG